MWKILLVFLILFWLVWFLKFAKHYPNTENIEANRDFWGLTFSTKFAKSIDLDWEAAYLAILDDLQVSYIRLPIYWDEVEKIRGEFDFKDYDFILNEGQKRGVKFVVNIGARLPRWPECHLPAWLESSSQEIKKAETLQMLEMFVERYKGREEIISWQIENEPLVDWFGTCPKSDEEFLKKEVALVKSLDQRPVIISASGELSLWSREAKITDILANTVYRVVWNPVFKYFRYPLPAWFYQFKANRVNKTGEQMIVSELQAEPWVPYGKMTDLSLEEINKSFSLEQFKANLAFAQKINFDQTYLWGVEWWYWQKLYGDDQYWRLAKTLWQN
ncbi:cellulase family glycosylhydrolase [Candidatus Nomurabacteria bacterium]|nr:cellulase family glycosylhydrolase [Candidatus Nomurabacteria bacterium]